MYKEGGFVGEIRYEIIFLLGKPYKLLKFFVRTC